jgi:hypothetical protein
VLQILHDRRKARGELPTQQGGNTGGTKDAAA